MPENNQILSVEGQLVGMPLAGPESFSQQQLDYLKRALGVDETVLWEGTYSGTIGSSNYITLSESCANFEYIEITNGGTYKSTYRFRGSSRTLSFIQSFANTGGTTIYANLYTVDNSVPKITCNSSNSFGVYANGISSWTNRGSMDVGETILTRIVGVHRISGGN